MDALNWVGPLMLLHFFLNLAVRSPRLSCHPLSLELACVPATAVGEVGRVLIKSFIAMRMCMSCFRLSALASNLSYRVYNVCASLWTR